ncbi:amidohydrolase [Ferrigenium kumadai]|uniref:Amidohydrolase n=1 Tax=Ferrigenium kumadai TaxID=1682490 RepID=A0AAN1W163_9PROT|nr:nitrilase-related carbon-nitrogen hydrolase [Ferrigenium kumadai]BBJ00657.1 amidohydrolase [Ferrigenium kumadai]
MKIAVSSLDQAWKNKAVNRIACERQCARAAKERAQLIVFPEMTLTGYCMEAESLAEVISDSETTHFFQSIARKYSIAVVFGYIAKDKGFYLNRAVLVDSKGIVLAEYDKIHPFVHAGEDRVFKGGEKLAVANIDNVNIGLTVCYDLRFPEVYTAMARRADLVINIANWPARRFLHWDTLLRARAIENQYCMLGVNRTGTDGNGVEYCKSTCCYFPSGEKLPMIALEDTLDLIVLDTQALGNYRAEFPTISSRRDAVYAGIHA